MWKIVASNIQLTVSGVHADKRIQSTTFFLKTVALRSLGKR